MAQQSNPPSVLAIGGAASAGPAIGEQIPANWSLPGVDGKNHPLASYRDAKALVLAFLGDVCPAARECVGRLRELERGGSGMAVRVVGINSNNPFLSPADALERMREWALTNSLNFPYLKDPDGAVARLYGVRVTPEFVVLDADQRLRYRGRMSDSRVADAATSYDLGAAVESVLAGRTVVVAETAPLGCSIV